MDNVSVFIGVLIDTNGWKRSSEIIHMLDKEVGDSSSGSQGFENIPGGCLVYERLA